MCVLFARNGQGQEQWREPGIKITIESGSGILCLYALGLGCEIHKENRLDYGISILTSPHKLSLSSAELQADRNERFCVELCQV